jgi:hypothetical protein
MKKSELKQLIKECITEIVTDSSMSIRDVYADLEKAFGRGAYETDGGNAATDYLWSWAEHNKLEDVTDYLRDLHWKLIGQRNGGYEYEKNNVVIFIRLEKHLGRFWVRVFNKNLRGI